MLLSRHKKGLILQRSADRVPGNCLKERVEQRRQADVHIQHRPLYFSFFFFRFTHAYIGRLETHFFFPPCVNYNYLDPIASRSAAALGILSCAAHQTSSTHAAVFLCFSFLFFFILIISPTSSRRWRRSLSVSRFGETL